jgi:hypothetical protein
LGGGQGQRASWRGGVGAQALASKISTREAKRATQRMWVIYLEIVLALGLAAFIVWFTWPKKRPPGDDKS